MVRPWPLPPPPGASQAGSGPEAEKQEARKDPLSPSELLWSLLMKPSVRMAFLGALELAPGGEASRHRVGARV